MGPLGPAVEGEQRPQHLPVGMGMGCKEQGDRQWHTGAWRENLAVTAVSTVLIRAVAMFGSPLCWMLYKYIFRSV